MTAPTPPSAADPSTDTAETDTPAPAPRRGRSKRAAAPDAVCARAVEVARAAVVDLAGDDAVGEHLGVAAEGDRTVTHRFATTARGYRGWVWVAVLTRPPRARSITVSETCLLPEGEAVLAPQWLPWSDRIAPGDVGVGDVLPRREDDPYLQQGYAQTDDEESDRVALTELGLGRVRVLSPEGREAAATRWYDGDHGPQAPVAREAAAPCSTCGYLLRVDGGLRTVFGVCANEWSPSDGAVVSMDHGCGAHSETDLDIAPLPRPEPVLDEFAVDEV